jgi:hypothetical protein
LRFFGLIIYRPQSHLAWLLFPSRHHLSASEDSELKLLITNHHLSEFAGSELLTFELARASLEQGHEVSVFTFFPGKVSKRITDELGIGVFDPTTLHSLKVSEIDVINVHHWPTYLYLKQRGIDKPVVFGFLGVSPPLENPPPIELSQNPFWWGVSEEVVENVSSISGWDMSRDNRLIRNWAIEIGPVRSAVSSKEALHFGVVSNHFPDEFKNALQELSNELGFQISFIGLPDNSQDINLSTLLGFDAIISLGRTAITAICNGIPTLVLDHSGLDGWVTTENYLLLRKKNFSGRTNAEFPSKENLRHLIAEMPSHSSASDLATLARPDHDLTDQVSKILALCKLSINSKSLVKFPKAADVALEYLGRSFHFEAMHAALLAERDSALTERDSALTERDSALTERDSALTERDSALTERDSALTERDSALTERDLVFTSKSWKITMPLRALNRLLQRLKTHT